MKNPSLCPRCGGHTFTAYAYTDAEYQEKCFDCDLCGPETTDCEKDSAVRLWNTFCKNYKSENEE